MLQLDIRCGHCQRKLATGRYIELQIKCPRCGTLNLEMTMSKAIQVGVASPAPWIPDSAIRWHVSGREV